MSLVRGGGGIQEFALWHPGIENWFEDPVVTKIFVGSTHSSCGSSGV